jgi:DNA mismatch endonuclease (patch repair protein)
LKKAKTYNQFGEEVIHIPRFEAVAGFYSTQKSSAAMKKIKSKNNANEIKLRKHLWALGYRYRINMKSILGKPDLVFIRENVVVFIDGDFWHGYNWESRKEKLKTNREYWIPKIERNIQRDKETTFKLSMEGWKVIRFWEHEIEKSFDNCIREIIDVLKKKHV